MEEKNDINIDWKPIQESIDEMFRAAEAMLAFLKDSIKVDAQGNPYFDAPIPSILNCQDEPHLIASDSDEADSILDMWLAGRE